MSLRLTYSCDASWGSEPSMPCRGAYAARFDEDADELAAAMNAADDEAAAHGWSFPVGLRGVHALCPAHTRLWEADREEFARALGAVVEELVEMPTPVGVGLPPGYGLFQTVTRPLPGYQPPARIGESIRRAMDDLLRYPPQPYQEVVSPREACRRGLHDWTEWHLFPADDDVMPGMFMRRCRRQDCEAQDARAEGSL